MSQGNVNVSLNDGLYYIHYNSVNVYKSKQNPKDLRTIDQIPSHQRNQFNLDLPLSQANYDAWLEQFRKAMCKRYKSYRIVDKYLKRTQRIVLENNMFQVIIEDNEWSFAVELISIPQCPYKAFQKHLFSQFFKGMREILFTITETIYIRNGSWSAEPFTASDQDKLDEHIKAAQIKLDPNVKATGGYNDDFKRKISSDEPE